MTEKPAVVEHVWENHPPYQLGGDISATWGTTTEGGPTQTDDTCTGALQPGQRTGNPGLLDRIDEETGREEESSLTFDLNDTK